MKNPGKKIRLAQPVKQVSVDAALLPKAGPAPRETQAEAPGKARVNIVAPMHPALAVRQRKMQQQAVKSAVATVGAAVEAGTVKPADAKRLLLARARKTEGSAEAAEKWYRGHHLEAFGGRTPAQMVRAGELKALLEHLAGNKP